MVSTQKFPLADQRPLTEVNLPRQLCGRKGS